VDPGGDLHHLGMAQFLGQDARRHIGDAGDAGDLHRCVASGNHFGNGRHADGIRTVNGEGQDGDIELLEDLIMAAINDGYTKADKVYEEKMGKFGNMGGLGGLL